MRIRRRFDSRAARIGKLKRHPGRHLPARFECPYCGTSRTELIDITSPQETGVYFSTDVDGDGLQELIDFVTCRCGAEFLWVPPGRDAPAGMPETYHVCRIKDVPNFKSWKLLATKEPLVVRTYKLRSRKGGTEYSWPHRLIRIPGNFKLILDGPYVTYHKDDGSIILKPFKTGRPS